MKAQLSLLFFGLFASLATAAWQQSQGQDYVTTESWEISFKDNPKTTTTKYVELTPELIAKLLSLQGSSPPNPSPQNKNKQPKPPPADWKSHADSYELPLSHGWGSSGWKPREEGSSGSGSNRWGNGWQPRDIDSGPSNTDDSGSNRWGGSWKGGSGGDTGGTGSGPNKWGGSWPAK